MAKQFQSFEDLVGQPKEITEIFESESDRGAVLILAAYLEEVLGCLIAASCISDAAADDLLEFRGPAGGFDLKVRLCHAMGIIHESEKKGLDTIRRIRNAAAHFDRKRGFDVLFDTEQTQALVSSLAQTQNLELKSAEPEAVRATFFLASRLLGSKLYMRGIEIVTPTPPLTLKEKANEIRELLKDTERGKAIEQMEKEALAGNPEPMFDHMKKMGEFLKSRLNESEK